VLQTADGRLHTSKRLTTYPDPSEACLAGLDELMAAAGASWAELARAVHGTTLGSNLVIERKATGVALVTTRGFGDILAIGRQKRYQLYDLQIDKPEPLIDRSMVFEVTERMLANGTPRQPLDEDDARTVIHHLRQKGVLSLAVCFLNSYVNPAHERRLGELVRQEAPEIEVSLSCEVSPQFREYERTSTTVVNAYLVRAVRDYLRAMTHQLQDRGFNSKLFVMQSGGGASSADSMSRFPVRMIESGPAAGALVAARYGELTGEPDLIAFDMGGTTAKLSLVLEGRPQTVDTFELHRVDLAPGSGLPIDVRSLDLVEIGAGGGSIARPELGTIRVGPDSAGSEPGPVCYGRGGSEPTVTDANLVLGYLNRDNFAGGDIKLDLRAAIHALAERVARPLGLSLEEAAWGIHAIVNLNMELATRVVSIERGRDPRQLALVGTGGCGPVHACRIARSLGVRRVILPAAAGVASAIGLLTAEVKFDLSRTRLVRLDQADGKGVDELFASMEAEASSVVAESTGSAPIGIVREVDLRYVGQGYELTVPYESVSTVRDSFDELYGQRYGQASREEPVEATTWRLTAIGASQPVALPERQAGPAPQPGRRQAYFPECEGFTETLVYERDQLSPGLTVEGPAIVEERGSTTVLPPGARAVADRYGSLLVEW
jgi:N-methylhydantoinase A